MSTDPGAEANRLYWETDASVSEIAERLDISRRALYDALRPRPTGDTCGACGALMVWENRSARTNGTTHCISCGTGRPPSSHDDPGLAGFGDAGNVGDAEADLEAPDDDAIDFERHVAPAGVAAAYRDPDEEDACRDGSPTDARLRLSSAILAGVAAGMLATLLLVPRR